MLLGCALSLLALASQAQHYNLAVAVPGQGLTSSVGMATARRVVTDPAGNMYVAGVLSGVLRVGATP
jgi:hypothetical protein